MKPVRMKGATVFDQCCHNVFSGHIDGLYRYAPRRSGVACGHCGQELWTYYCEERLFLVECSQCRVKALVEARNPKDAAYMALGGVKEAGR